jgi:hypothetical protein
VVTGVERAVWVELRVRPRAPGVACGDGTRVASILFVLAEVGWCGGAANEKGIGMGDGMALF